MGKPLRPDQRQKIQSLIDSGKLKLARTRAPNGTSPRRPKRTARLPRPDVPAPSAPSSSASKRAKPPVPKKNDQEEARQGFLTSTRVAIDADAPSSERFIRRRSKD